MKRTELLAPAGNFECLRAAIHNGADAVYLGGKNFGARAYASNFDNDEMIEAIEYCHLYGVKIYVTVNTLIKESEIEECLNYIKFLHQSGVDAVIMQDLGMINLVHQTLPNLEIHASTQCHTTCDDSLEFLKVIGCKRAVLAREMSIDEIKKLKCDVEKEVFIHGALCISYSGQCLFSSMVLNRSGNRGECAGMCRLPYEAYNDNEKIETEGKYILSPKELCTINNLKDILDLKIESLKIEGRMKSPIYVGYVTNIYRKYIDAYYNNEDITPTEEEIKILKVLYNREFTRGHLFNETNIMNQKTPNHIGYKIGIVKSISKKIKILLIEDIEQGDAIRFINNNLGMYLNFIYDEKGNLINKAKKGDIIYIDNKVDLKEIDDVYITYDKSLENITNNLKKIPITFIVKAHSNEQLEISIVDDQNKITKLGSFIESANNNPTTKEIIEEKLSKINDTPFKLKNIEFDIDNNIFLRMSEINNIRRELIEQLIEKRKTTKKEFVIKEYQKSFKLNKNVITEIRIINEEEKYLNNPKIYFYTENKKLYDKYKQNKNIYYILPRICNSNIDYSNEFLVVNNTGDLYKYFKNNNIHTGIYMNVYNSYTIELLNKYKVDMIALSPELKEADLSPFKTLDNTSYLLYGRLELMIIKNNIFYDHINKASIKDRKNQTLNYYKKNNYYVLEHNSKKFYNDIIENLITIKEE